MEELDEIEQELGGQPTWELNKEEWDLLLGWPSLEPTKQQRAIATAAVKKYQEWIAGQCGPEPDPKNVMQHAFWRATQAGYAKGLQEMGK